ncbi:uncharacterized protein LOC120141734 [Hibiscus syriacus]|uniref:uncharacterized protein LOC120141734 n=1 Tax=Hibiscus syriacus TaxID=106335 RepID=UPI001923146A|nr:uncharacterized protein LOC120141734 [Hibiscus syriacus]
MRSQQQNHPQRDQLSCAIYELSALALNRLRCPPTPTHLADHSPMRTKITTEGFGWLMLGISVSLMLCGSVTFFLGFMLMPWIVGLLMVFYVVGIVSTISMFGRRIFCYVMTPPPPGKDNISEWKLL